MAGTGSPTVLRRARDRLQPATAPAAPHRFAMYARSLALVLFALLLGSCGREPFPAGPREGDPFPDVTLEGMDGTRLAVTGMRGKVVVLNVWAPWCAPCVEEMPSLQRLSERLDPARFAVLGLTVDDDPYLAEEFLRRTGVSFPNFMDRKRRIADGLLGVAAFPETFIIARDGTVVGRVTGGQAWDRPQVISGLERTYREAPEAIVGTGRGRDG